MLLSSSKRAFSSTTTATCLPFSTASSSASTIGELRPSRYSVILMASTSGSLRGLAQEFDHGLERLVGMMQQLILLADQIEDVVFLRRETGRSVGQERLVLQIGAIQRSADGASG